MAQEQNIISLEVFKPFLADLKDAIEHEQDIVDAFNNFSINIAQSLSNMDIPSPEDPTISVAQAITDYAKRRFPVAEDEGMEEDISSNIYAKLECLTGLILYHQANEDLADSNFKIASSCTMVMEIGMSLDYLQKHPDEILDFIGKAGELE